MLLAKCMQEIRRHGKMDFGLEFIVMDPGYHPDNRALIEENAKLMGIPIRIFESDIFNVVVDVDESPCYLCARMRRGYLYANAKELGCNKIALGHHSDDVVETFFLSLLYESRINTFMPVTYLDRKQITLIRPLVFVKEKDIIFDKTCRHLPLIQSTCPADGHTKRQTVKNMLEQLKKEIPDLNPRIMSAIQNKNQMRLWF